MRRFQVCRALVSACSLPELRATVRCCAAVSTGCGGPGSATVQQPLLLPCQRRAHYHSQTHPSAARAAGANEPALNVAQRAGPLQNRWFGAVSTHPASLLLSFILGGGFGAAGAAVYGTPAFNLPSGDNRGADSSDPTCNQPRWWDITLDSLLAAASFSGAAKRTRVAQLEAAGTTASLGPHFIADAAAKALPAVVNITVNHNFGPPSRGIAGFGVFGSKSSGSGFIVDAGGVILTNAHVVMDSSGRQPATGITVTLQDGRIYEGEVTTYDRVSDIAVLKVQSREPLPTVELGNSAGLRVGEWVVSLGSPLHLQNSVTHGIISCVDRKAVDLGLAGACPEYIQTDAPINQGSSGGPLVNLNGEVIGMTSMKALAADGVSFAIPIDTAKRIIQQLSDKGRVVRPYIGIKMLELNPKIAAQLRQRDPRFPDVNEGIVVVHVTPGSPAERAGLQSGDVIVDFQCRDGRGAPVRPGSLCAELIHALSLHVGSALELKVLRTSPAGDAATHDVQVKASEAVSRD